MLNGIIDWFFSLPLWAALGIGVLTIIVFFILLLAAGAVAFILFYTFARVIKGLKK